VPEWTAAPFVPDAATDVETLAAAAQRCTGCPLYHDTTQTVFGAGRTRSLVLVGEQPGDREDRVGAPFVGPAGRVLDQCLAQAGVGRDAVYLTNAVKHFKHEDRGKRRLHKRPNTDEIEACHPWLEAELRVVRPTAVVAMGATAVRALLGKALPIEANRHRVHEVGGLPVVVTYHPSAVLRAKERASELRAMIVADLVLAATEAGLRVP
jgi:uracil-DNA glycosylase family protein